MFVTDPHSQTENDTLVRAQMRDLDSTEPALEVIVLWGDQSVLHVAHLSPPRAFYVGGTPADAENGIDLVLGAESIGSERLPITLQDGSDTFAVIPQGARGYVACGDQLLSFDEAAAHGHMARCDELAGASQCRLGRDMSARIEYCGFTFLVRPTLAARRVGVGGGLTIDWSASRFTLSSVLLHLGLLLLFYFAPPRSTVLAIDRMGLDSRMVDYLVTPEVTPEPDPSWDRVSDSARDEGGDKGQAHEGDDGRSGKRDAPKTKHALAIAGPADNQDPHMARELARNLIQSGSIIGILQSNVGTLDGPTSPYGREQAEGTNAENALGALLGSIPGESYGEGGLGMVGPGRGGGGNAKGSIGVGDVATLGHAGNGRARYGVGVGGLGDHKAIVPGIHVLKPEIRGSLSKEVIRRTVQLHLNEVRYCYEQGLHARPDLQGRVAVRFIIGPSGAVTIATPAGSNLGVRDVENCIVDAVARWTFPAPEGGGLVVVTYPFMLQQAGG